MAGTENVGGKGEKQEQRSQDNLFGKASIMVRDSAHGFFRSMANAHVLRREPWASRKCRALIPVLSLGLTSGFFSFRLGMCPGPLLR